MTIQKARLHLFKNPILLAVIWFLMGHNAIAQTVYQDGMFDLVNDWTLHGPFFTPDSAPGAVAVSSRQSGDGNPADYLRIGVGHPTVASGSAAAGAILINDALSYDPADPLFGPIQTIDFEFDGRRSPGGRLDRVVSLALEQNGFRWGATEKRLFLGDNEESWTALGISGLQQSDFTAHIGSPSGQPANPDFSAGGLPITFGIVTLTSCPATSDCSSTVLKSVDLDNWTVTVNSGPPPQNPGTLAFLTSSVEIIEGAVRLSPEVRRTNGTVGQITVDFDTRAVSATAGSDYVAAAGTLTFADGEFQKTIDIDILDDTDLEGRETFDLVLSNPTGGATLGTLGSTSIAIIDDESMSDADLRISLTVTNVSNQTREYVNDQGDTVSIFDEATAGVFSELPFRYEVSATVTNDGPFEVGNVLVRFGIPKEAVAAFDILPVDRRSACTVDSASNNLWVLYECEIAAPIPVGGSTIFPTSETVGKIYVGYAATVADQSVFEYQAEILSFAGTDPDSANNVATPISLTINNPTGNVPPIVARLGGGGGAVGPSLLLLLIGICVAFRGRYCIACKASCLR